MGDTFYVSYYLSDSTIARIMTERPLVRVVFARICYYSACTLLERIWTEKQSIKKVQGVPESQTAANPRHQEEEKKWQKLTRTKQINTHTRNTSLIRMHRSPMQHKHVVSSFVRQNLRVILQSKNISNDQELIQSDPISCPQNQKGNS